MAEPNPLEHLHAALLKRTEAGTLKWVSTGFGAYGTQVGSWFVEVVVRLPTHGPQEETLRVRMSGSAEHVTLARQRFEGHGLSDAAMGSQETVDGVVEGILGLLSLSDPR